MTTEDFVRHDSCPRFQTWSREFELPRIPLSEVLHQSLRSGLLAGDPCAAYQWFMARASNPGIDIEGYNVYDVAQHHASLAEVVCAYLLGADGAWKQAEAVSWEGIEFQPLSFQMADGRLRRVVLCSTWNTLRELEEKNSWWTVADTAATGRPMLINAIVIGQSRGGFRLSPWTTGFRHPENGVLRIKKKEGRFTDNWKRIYRENTDFRTADWLQKMQEDGAFEDVVFSVTADVPPRRADVLLEMEQMAGEMGSLRARRSSCYRYAPCPMIRLCPAGATPEMAQWKRRVAP